MGDLTYISMRIIGKIVIYWGILHSLITLARSAPLLGLGESLILEPLKYDNSGVLQKSGFVSGFVSSLSMIIVSELGDKTFFIAAVMAMKHPRVTVFSGAITALAFMTILSALFGFVTTFIPRVYTYYISTALFAIFGLKMLYDGAMMGEDEGAEELEEVNQTLKQREEDENTPLAPFSREERKESKLRLTIRRLLSTCFSKTYIQALTMTFLAEWGDRSQLATVALAARESLFAVCLGGILGHSFCTGLAVLGGRMIAQRISVKTVTIVGGFVFLGFAVISLFRDPNS